MRLLAACTIGICAYSAEPAKINLACSDVPKTIRLLEMAKVRSQELYLIEDPERYQEDRKLADETIDKLRLTNNKDCTRE